MENKPMLWAFQITKTIIFEVSYYYCGNNKHPYFSTSANEFNRPKNDWKSGGQAQERLLPNPSPVRAFWDKWDVRHLHALTDTEYNDLIKDINKLKTIYNYIEREQNTPHKIDYIPFYHLKELSKMNVPNMKNKPARYM